MTSSRVPDHPPLAGAGEGLLASAGEGGVPRTEEESLNKVLQEVRSHCLEEENWLRREKSQVLKPDLESCVNKAEEVGDILCFTPE